MMRYIAVVWQDKDSGFYLAEVPELGCMTQGETESEARENIESLVPEYVEDMRAKGEAIPQPSASLT
jgi:predicted RNase H-like HicB family nuclease